MRPDTSAPTLAQTQMAKSAHQYSGCPPLPVQLDSKCVPPSVFVVHAPWPTFAVARVAMALPLTAVTADCVEATSSPGPGAAPEHPTPTPAATNASAIPMRMVIP